MSRFSEIALFLISNIVGFFAAPFCYYIGYFTGVISADNSALSGDMIKVHLINGTMITWVVCALFSTAFFLLSGKLRYFFLAAPAIIPLGYGLTVLYGSLSLGS